MFIYKLPKQTRESTRNRIVNIHWDRSKLEEYVNNIGVDVIIDLLDMLQNNVSTAVINDQLSNVLINAAKSTLQDLTNTNNGNNHGC